jgi:hypothetical protein
MKKIILITSILFVSFFAKAQRHPYALKPWDTIISSNHDSIKTEYKFYVLGDYKHYNGDSIVGFIGEYTVKADKLGKFEFRTELKWKDAGVTVNRNTLNVQWDRTKVIAQLRLKFIAIIAGLPNN